MRKHQKPHAGFTLIELLTVIAIIGFLVSVSIGTAKYAKSKSMQARTRSDIAHIADAVNEFRLRFGAVPGALDLIVGNLPPNVDLIDPWENDYIYTTNGTRSVIIHSQGPDTSIDEDDISSRD